ncbi:hypothetical protein Acsp02_05230 [Actinoplanes sp. NBRC 103695]|nr:hypothetical protein Acsp02_05230 [Actinoplanes sp. NBRC 103695]
MALMDDFTMTVSEHRYLAPGATEINTILTVRAGTEPGEATPAALAEVIVVDASGSMTLRDKMANARRATIAAIEMLPEGARFAVVAGDTEARMVYPRDFGLATAGSRARREARAAIRATEPSGGTHIGVWLGLARRLLADRPDDVRHVTLLTDGQNQEQPGVLTRALDDCRDVFQCDARGIGADWNADELIAIAETLRGQARAITATTDLAADFRSVVGAWRAKSVRDLTLRIELSRFARLRHFRQVHPTKTELDSFTRPAGEQAVTVATGAWAAGELREYELGVDVGRAGELNTDLRAGRVDAFVGGRRRAAPAVVLLRRTEGGVLSLPLDDKSRRYSLEAQMSRALGDGCAAYLRKEGGQAERDVGRAVAIAHEAGDQDMLDRIARVAEIDDPAAGLVRLRPDVPDEWWLELAVDKTYSRQSRTDRRCVCGFTSAPGARTCEECRREL